jgi:hypothetical protein
MIALAVSVGIGPAAEESSASEHANWLVAQGDTEAGEAAPAETNGEQPFFINSQDFPDALNAFAVQSGARVEFDVDALSGVDSNSLEDNLSNEKALRRLLFGTGVNFSRNEAEAFVIESTAADNATIVTRALGGDAPEKGMQGRLVS